MSTILCAITWWRHQMETFSAILALCAGNSSVTGEFPSPKASDMELKCILICAWIKSWVNNRDADDLRRYHAHYDVIAMQAVEFRFHVTEHCLHYWPGCRWIPSTKGQQWRVLTYRVSIWSSYKTYLDYINQTNLDLSVFLAVSKLQRVLNLDRHYETSFFRKPFFCPVFS